MNRYFKKLIPDWRILLSASLVVLAAPPFGYSSLMAIALLPWFWAMDRATEKNQSVLITGFWMGYFMTLGLFYWVGSTLYHFGGLPIPVAVLGLLLFGLIGEPQFYFISHLFKTIIARPTPLRILMGSFLYAGVDWALPKLFVDTLGHVFHNSAAIRQVADLGGPPLLTALIVMFNLTLWSVIQNFKSRGQPSLWPALQKSLAPLLMMCICVGGAGFYGKNRLKQVHEWMKNPIAQIPVALIQGNIGDFDKLASERGVRGAADQVVTTMLDLSNRALTQSVRPAFLVWPETTYPSNFGAPETPSEEQRDERLRRFTRENNIPLYFGGYDHALGKEFNSLFFLTPTGETKIYHKNILLLFGEYIPGMENGPLQFLKAQFPQIGNFGRGPGPQAIEVQTGHSAYPSVKMSPVICYEALFANYTLEAARAGAEVIANITNDSWFGMSSEPSLHLSLTQFRSIESRLPQFRSTNTGYSAIILPDGEISKMSGLFAPEILSGTLPISDPLPTLMRAWGDWFGPTALALSLALLLMERTLRKRQLSKLYT